MCAGCYNEEYHYGLGGSKMCWSFESAKIEKKIKHLISEDIWYQRERYIYCSMRGYVEVKP